MEDRLLRKTSQSRRTPIPTSNNNVNADCHENIVDQYQLTYDDRYHHRKTTDDNSTERMIIFFTRTDMSEFIDTKRTMVSVKNTGDDSNVGISNK